ncbi:MAG: hypothetical protein IJ856_02225 [Candidatus Methanomethylophilaceae archaeon]|nr:hypothetical protein [Candidatus Methanomethylophilaceae archaeon]
MVRWKELLLSLAVAVALSLVVVSLSEDSDADLSNDDFDERPFHPEFLPGDGYAPPHFESRDGGPHHNHRPPMPPPDKGDFHEEVKHVVDSILGMGNGDSMRPPEAPGIAHRDDSGRLEPEKAFVFTVMSILNDEGYYGFSYADVREDVREHLLFISMVLQFSLMADISNIDAGREVDVDDDMEQSGPVVLEETDDGSEVSEPAPPQYVTFFTDYDGSFTKPSAQPAVGVTTGGIF